MIRIPWINKVVVVNVVDSCILYRPMKFEVVKSSLLPAFDSFSVESRDCRLCRSAFRLKFKHSVVMDDRNSATVIIASIRDLKA